MEQLTSEPRWNRRTLAAIAYSCMTWKVRERFAAWIWKDSLESVSLVAQLGLFSQQWFTNAGQQKRTSDAARVVIVNRFVRSIDAERYSTGYEEVRTWPCVCLTPRCSYQSICDVKPAVWFNQVKTIYISTTHDVVTWTGELDPVPNTPLFNNTIQEIIKRDVEVYSIERTKIILHVLPKIKYSSAEAPFDLLLSNNHVDPFTNEALVLSFLLRIFHTAGTDESMLICVTRQVPERLAAIRAPNGLYDLYNEPGFSSFIQTEQLARSPVSNILFNPYSFHPQRWQ